MIQLQNFTVQETSSVKGGSASYTVDSDTGKLSYGADVIAKIPPALFHLTKEEKANGDYTVDPSVLKSGYLQKPGDSFRVGSVSFVAQEVTPGSTSVELSGPGFSGTGILDTTGEIVKVRRLEAKVSVGPLSFDVIAVPVALGFWATLRRFFR